MESIAPTAFASIAAWQAVLDAHRELFDELVPGAWLGVVLRHRTGPDGAKHSVAIPVTPPVPMLVLMRESERMTARSGEFCGLINIAANALFVADEGAIGKVLDCDPRNALHEMKRHIRTGAVALFFLCARRELFELGYEEFFEALGLPFLGSCR